MLQISKVTNRIFLTLAAAALLSSCGPSVFGGGIDGNGKVTTENRKVTGDFTNIEASNGLEVVIEQSGIKSITVEADENLQEHIITRIESGTLIIETDESIDEAKARRVTVKLPKIEEIQASSGCSVNSGNVLKGEALKIKSSSGSEIELALEMDRIECKSSSGSNITLSGKTLSLETTATSGSEIEAEKLFANDVTSETTSGSSTKVHPIVSLKAKATSGSSIDYNNVPKSLSKDESSGGSISQE